MNETIAYIAGLIDGEGHIGIKRTRRLYNGRVNPLYQERFQIRMVQSEGVQLIADTFGGKLYQEKPQADQRRPLFCYQASDQKAVNIIRATLPYLRVKRQVAETVLKLRQLKEAPDQIQTIIPVMSRWGKPVMMRRARHSPIHIARCEALAQLCHAINIGNNELYHQITSASKW